MEKEVSANELQGMLIEFLNGVSQKGDQLIVKHADKPLAAIIPIDIYKQMLKQREKSFSVLNKIWENVPTVCEEEAQTDIEQAIIEGRAELALNKHETS